MPILKEWCRRCAGDLLDNGEEIKCVACGRETDEDGYPLFHPIGADTQKHGAHQMKVNRARY